MNSIPIADPGIGTTEKERVEQVLESGQLADGPEVRRFEDEFASHCNANHAIATSNGTTALHTALRAVGIGPGDHVVTTPFSFIATANAIRLCGATPVFADIDPKTYTLDPDAVDTLLRDHADHIEAIVPVHLYGLPADMEPLLELANSYDLAVVEDAAQAHGAEYRGKPVGSLGDAGCFSFYPTKNMTTGEGGMITTDRDDVETRARQFINHGRSDGNDRGYEHIDIGHNFRMTSISAAIGRIQLQKLPRYTRVRRDYAATITQQLADVPGITEPTEPADRRHVFHQYTVQCADRDALKSYLAANGIGAGIYYPTPIHLQPAYRSTNRSFPISERAAEKVLSLPIHPSLTSKEVRTVAETVREEVMIEGGVADD